VKRAAIAAIALAIAAAIASAALAVAHERARAAWQVERSEQGTAAYDAARSDALWAEADAWRRARDRASLAGALLLAVAGAATGAFAAPLVRGTERAPKARVLAATLVDAVIAAVAVASVLLVPLGEWIAGALSAVLAATLARGTSPGLAIAGLVAVAAGGARPGPARAIAAAVLLPVSLAAFACVLVALASDRRAWLAPHLAMCGLEPVLR
jgi:hypothetical protein